MTYIITKTNGEELTEILDNSIDTNATDLALIGKNVIGYGEHINENFVKLLENFASTSEPNNPIVGQLWYDLTEERVKVYDGNGFAVASGPVVGPNPPLTPNQGDFWIDNNENQVFAYDGVDRILVGPIYKNSQGLSGFEVITIKDSLGNSKTVTALWNNSNLLGVWSHHADFVPVGLSGFSSTIKPGFNFNPNIQGGKLHGTAAVAESLADSLGNIRSVDELVFTDKDNTLEGTITIINPEPLILGLNQESTVLVNTSSLQIRNNINNQDIKLTTRNNSNFVDAITIKGATNRIGIFKSNPSSTVDVNGNVTISGNLTVTGSTVTINSTELSIDDKSITLAATANPSDILADGGGIILSGTTDHTLLWSNTNKSWDSSENFNLAAGKAYRINNVNILTETALSASVTSAPGLTKVGILEELKVDNIDIYGSTITSGETILTLTGIAISLNGITVGAPGVPDEFGNRRSRISNLQSPIEATDAATKKYVDEVSEQKPWVEVTPTVDPYQIEKNDRLLISTLVGPVVVTLPESPAVGDFVRFVDNDGSFHINPLTIRRPAGVSVKILSLDQDLIVDRKNAAFGLIYTDTGQGWVYIETFELPEAATIDIVGDVIGNLTGNVIGNVQGNLEGNVIGNLTGIVLTTDQPNITNIGTLTNLSVSNTISSNAVEVQSRFKLPRYTSEQRAARTMTSNDYGELIYNLTTNKVQAYTSTGWVDLH